MNHAPPGEPPHNTRIFAHLQVKNETCETVLPKEEGCRCFMVRTLSHQSCTRDAMMTKYGIGASALRKEDERFLRGRGQYVGDFRLAGMHDVAFVRSPVAHARLHQVCIPDQFRNAVFTAGDLLGVKPILSAPPIKGFKRSHEPILATEKLRYVGEIVAMCIAPTRAQAL